MENKNKVGPSQKPEEVARTPLENSVRMASLLASYSVHASTRQINSCKGMAIRKRDVRAVPGEAFELGPSVTNAPKKA